MKPSHLPSPCNVEFHLVVLPFSLHVSVGAPTSNKQVNECAVFSTIVGDLYAVKIDVNWADSWYVTCLCNKQTVLSKYAVMRIPSREQSHIPPLLRALLSRWFSQQNPRKRICRICDRSLIVPCNRVTFDPQCALTQSQSPAVFESTNLQPCTRRSGSGATTPGSKPFGNHRPCEDSVLRS